MKSDLPEGVGLPFFGVVVFSHRPRLIRSGALGHVRQGREKCRPEKMIRAPMLGRVSWDPPGRRWMRMSGVGGGATPETCSNRSGLG